MFVGHSHMKIIIILLNEHIKPTLMIKKVHKNKQIIRKCKNNLQRLLNIWQWKVLKEEKNWTSPVL